MKHILAQTDHRPYPRPQHMWLWYQEWNNVVFMHGRVDARWLQQHIPDGLTLDTFDGSAWISIVAFRMERIGPRFLPAVSAMSDFNEVNIRTYVSVGEKTGVYFLSMEGSKKLSVYLAKTISGLPYYHTPMTFTDKHLQTPSLSFNYTPAGVITHKSEFDLWLTERYCLYYDFRNKLYRYDIHHIAWHMQQVQVSGLSVNYSLLHSMPQVFQPEAFHYSPGVRVAAWPAELVLK
jgi:uncharacterized protein YqjF (DUF2071 family)